MRGSLSTGHVAPESSAGQHAGAPERQRRPTLRADRGQQPSGARAPRQVLDRGERIELLVDKTDHLQSESFAFNREARVLRRRLWWKNARLLAAAGALVLLIVYAIVAVACSPTFQC